MIKYLYQEAVMLDITQDIQPLTTFRNNSVKFMRRLKKSKQPIVLTVNGRPEAVLQSAAEYQRMASLARQANEQEGIRQGLRALAEGNVRPATEVFAELDKEYGIPGSTHRSRAARSA
jgi:prevent-host-death family protein